MATEPFEPFSFDFSNDASNEKIEASAVPKESDNDLVPENSGASFSLTEGESSVGKFTFSTDNPFSSTSIQKSEEKTQQGGKSKRKSGSDQTSFEDALAGEVSDDDLPTLEHREEPPILESIIKVPKPGESVKFDFGGFTESNASGSSFSAQESNIPSSSTEINFQTSSSGLPFQPFSFSGSQPQSSSVQDDKPDDAIKSSNSFSFSDNPFSSTAPPPPTEKDTQQRHQQRQHGIESEDDVVFDTSAGDQFRFAELLQAAGANDFDLMNNVDQIDVEQILGHFKDELVAIGDDDESEDPNLQQYPDFDDSQLEQFASSMGNLMGNFGVPSSGASGEGSGLHENITRRRVVRGKRTGKAINSQDYNKLLEEMQGWGGLEDDEDGQNGDNDEEEEEDDNADDDDGMVVDSGFVADVSDNESDELEDGDDDNEDDNADEDDNDVLPELEWEENDPSVQNVQSNRSDKQQKKTSSTGNEDDT